MENNVIMIGNIKCMIEQPEDIIQPDHYNCKIDASTEIIELMKKVVSKIHIGV